MIDSVRDAWVERARAVTIEAEARRRGLHLQKQGHEFVGPCPVCRDGRDRFSINPKENAFYCRKCDRGGRDALSLVAFIEGLDLKLAKDFTWACQTLTGEEPPDVASKPNGSKRGNSDYPGKPAIVETFDYENADGELSYQRQRVEFDGDDGERVVKNGKRAKIFWQRRPDPDRPGKFIKDMDGVELLPFRLPELLEDLAAERTVFIVEGERKANLLRSWNIPATCGAKHWPSYLSKHFKDADVVALPDNDSAGLDHVDKVAASLIAVGARMRVLALPGLGPKGDVLDWAAAGGTAQDLIDLVEHDARPWRNGKTEPFQTAEMRGGDARKQRATPTIMHANVLKTKVFQPIKHIVRGYLVEGATILAGRPKIGKSWLALDWGLAVARGGFVFGDVLSKEGEVLYIALEDNERRLKSRITKLLGMESEWPEKFEYALEWAREGGIDDIKEWIKAKESPRLIVIDVLEAFRSRARGKDNVYAADYETIKALQLIASELHVAILIVHHLRKAASDGDAQDKISGTLGLTGAADSFLVLDSGPNGVTLEGRGRDIMELNRGVRFNRDTCRWEVLGEAADVRRHESRKCPHAAAEDGYRLRSAEGENYRYAHPAKAKLLN